MADFKVMGNVVGVPNPKPDAYTRSETDELLNKKANKEDISKVYKFIGSFEKFEDLPHRYALIPNIDLGKRLVPTLNGESLAVDKYEYDAETHALELINVTLTDNDTLSIPIVPINVKSGKYYADGAYYGEAYIGDISTYECAHFFTYIPVSDQTIKSVKYETFGQPEITINGETDNLGYLFKIIDSWLINKDNPDLPIIPSDAFDSGNVYNVLDTGMNYAWTGTAWDALGGEHKDLEHRGDKNNPHEVTAEQVGALPVEGGTLTGNLVVEDSIPVITLISKGNSDTRAAINKRGTKATAFSGVEIVDCEDGKNNSGVALRISNRDARNNIADAVKIHDAVHTNGSYRIYGEHNKPTAEDVGAYTKDEADALLDLKANKADIVNVYTYVGAVDTFGDLSNVEKVVGHVYNVRANGINYVWNGTEWDALGSESRDDSAHQRIDVLEEQKANISDVGNIESDVAGLNASVSGIEDELLNKADKSDVVASLELKADKSDVYKKGEVYSRSEIDKKLGEIDVNVDVSRSANALKGTASGEVISITDISPIEHNLGVKVSSKNLIPNTYKTITTKGVTFTVNEDGTITANGTATENISLILISTNNPISLVNGEKYSFSGSPQGSSYSTYYMALQTTDYDPAHNDVGKGITFTSKGKPLYLYISVLSGATLDNVVFKPMLEKGTVKTSYTPFVADVSSTTLKAQGKNLFNDDTSLIKTVIYYNSEGAEGKRFGYEISLPAGTYSIKASPKDNYSGNGYVFGSVVYENNTIKQVINTVVEGRFTSHTFTVENGDKVLVYNGVATANTTTAITKTLFSQLNFQIEAGESPTEFEEFKEPTSYKPMADGTVEGVVSIYPNTTLMADKQGVLIECEYNKDTNKVIENLVNAIISLGGNV